MESFSATNSAHLQHVRHMAHGVLYCSTVPVLLLFSHPRIVACGVCSWGLVSGHNCLKLAVVYFELHQQFPCFSYSRDTLSHLEPLIWGQVTEVRCPDFPHPQIFPPVLPGGFGGDTRPDEIHSLMSCVFLGNSSWWKTFLVRCQGGLCEQVPEPPKLTPLQGATLLQAPPE